jgi:hypothetical protein
MLIHSAFLGFDTLWNTPLGKCYNGTSVRLQTHVIVRITIWSFLASLLATHKLSTDIRNTNSVWKLSWLRRFPSCGSSDFHVFFGLFSLDFHVQLVPLLSRCLGSDFFLGITDRCLVHLCA